MRRLLLLLFLLLASVLGFGQSDVYNPTALIDYSPCTTLYLSTYNTCLFDTSPYFSAGSGTNTAPTQYDTDAKAAMNRVVPLNTSGVACSGPPYGSGCHIGMVFMGMSIPGRDTCYGTANGTLSSTCVAESFICQAVGTQNVGTVSYGCPAAQYLDCNTAGSGGNILVNHKCNADNQPILVLVNCAVESQQLEQWQNDMNSNYSHCDTQLSNHGLTPQQVEVVWFMGVDTNPENGGSYVIPATCCDIQHLINGGSTCDSRDYAGANVPYPANSGGTYPNTSPKSSTQIDMCMYLVNLGLVSRYIKTFRYQNTQQIFWNTINSTGWNRIGGAQPEPFAYETGFGIHNAISAQQKQKAGGYGAPGVCTVSSPTTCNAMTLDVNYDCNGALGGSGCTSANTTCRVNGTGAYVPCAPMWIWGTYSWAPCNPSGGNGCTATSARVDGFSWNLGDFTATDYVHPKSLGTGSDAGIMKMITDSVGGALSGSTSGILNNTYAQAWFTEAGGGSPTTYAPTGLSGSGKANGSAAIH